MVPAETDLRRAREQLAARDAELQRQGERLRDAEAELARERERFSTLFDLAPVGFVILDANGHIEVANERVAEMLGRTGGELVDKPLWAFSVGDADALREFLQGAARGAPEAPRRASLETARHEEIPVTLRAVSDAGSTLVAVLDQREETHTRELEREFVHRLLRAQDAERRLIAHELHDEAGQMLTAIEVGLRGLSKAMELNDVEQQARALAELVKRTGSELRRLARGLYPSVLDDLGLAPALERLATEQRQRANIPMTCS